MESQTCAVGGWGLMFGTNSQINTFFFWHLPLVKIFNSKHILAEGFKSSVFCWSLLVFWCEIYTLHSSVFILLSTSFCLVMLSVIIMEEKNKINSPCDKLTLLMGVYLQAVLITERAMSNGAQRMVDFIKRESKVKWSSFDFALSFLLAHEPFSS